MRKKSKHSYHSMAIGALCVRVGNLTNLFRNISASYHSICHCVNDNAAYKHRNKNMNKTQLICLVPLVRHCDIDSICCFISDKRNIFAAVQPQQRDPE